MTPLDATHAALLREVRIAREWGGKRYVEAQAALRRYVVDALRREPENAA